MSSSESEIRVPIYTSCLNYLEKYNQKMLSSYDVKVKAEMFNVKGEVKGGIVGLARISGKDSELYFNGLEYLCYPKDFYSITATEQGIKDVIRMAKEIKISGKEHYIDVSNQKISIHYNDVEERLKADVMK
ncbi:hypothetical protein [Neptuniibacter sp. UBA847]|uniref:hypothetical protein n=1 Tax=Neptuniibacter sp. UBA847 TaxID=1946977 RepID=UPI0025F44EBD|nr:hypothetical protein [Neptuniibacter sp. UBA847]